jgi:hypothetical protein
MATIGDVTTDADACALVRNVFGDRPAGPAGLNAGHAGLPIAKNTQGEKVVYWQMQNGSSLSVSGEAIVGLPAKRDVCSEH